MDHIIAPAIINKLIEQLDGPLPGPAAQYLMAPMGRRRKEDYGLETSFRKSAVMLLLCHDNQDLFIPLTERFAYDGVHSGQVSLPGGKFEDNDQTLVNTALRECEEEIGVNDVQVLGELSNLYIPVSNFLVQPVVGYCPDPGIFMSPHTREVKQIIRLTVDDLLNEKIVKEDYIVINKGLKIKAPYFEIEGLKVWGATAMILSEFKVMLKTIF